MSRETGYYACTENKLWLLLFWNVIGKNRKGRGCGVAWCTEQKNYDYAITKSVGCICSWIVCLKKQLSNIQNENSVAWWMLFWTSLVLSSTMAFDWVLYDCCSVLGLLCSLVHTVLPWLKDFYYCLYVRFISS